MMEVKGLTREKLIVATPMYGGMCSGFYMQGMMGLSVLAANYGIQMRTIILGDSLVTRARNRCVDIFKSLTDNPDDRLMWIDADIQFNPADVLKLMLIDKEVIGGLYPLKQINWKRVKNILHRNPEFPSESLPRAASDYVFNIKVAPGENSGRIDVAEPTLVKDLGTGFLMVKRKVFTAVEEAGLAKKYVPCINEEIFAGPELFDHFPAGIDRELGVGDEGAYLSEDWVFCRRWQTLGGEVYACPWIKLSHFGTMGFEGDLSALAASGSKIGEEYSWPQQ